VARKIDYFASRRKDGTWTVKSTGSGKVNSVYSSKEEAWKETRRLARGAGSEAILIGKNGKITAQNTYDNYSNPPNDITVK